MRNMMEIAPYIIGPDIDYSMPWPDLRDGAKPLPFGSSRNTVAADKRRAKKRKAVKRARRLGHA